MNELSCFLRSWASKNGWTFEPSEDHLTKDLNTEIDDAYTEMNQKFKSRDNDENYGYARELIETDAEHDYFQLKDIIYPKYHQLKSVSFYISDKGWAKIQLELIDGEEWS